MIFLQNDKVCAPINKSTVLDKNVMSSKIYCMVALQERSILQDITKSSWINMERQKKRYKENHEQHEHTQNINTEICRLDEMTRVLYMRH